LNSANRPIMTSLNTASPIIRLEGIRRTYHVGDVDVHALREVTLPSTPANLSPSWDLPAPVNRR
jgi:hypothetical protein